MAGCVYCGGSTGPFTNYHQRCRDERGGAPPSPPERRRLQISYIAIILSCLLITSAFLIPLAEGGYEQSREVGRRLIGLSAAYLAVALNKLVRRRPARISSRSRAVSGFVGACFAMFTQYSGDHASAAVATALVLSAIVSLLAHSVQRASPERPNIQGIRRISVHEWHGGKIALTWAAALLMLAFGVVLHSDSLIQWAAIGGLAAFLTSWRWFTAREPARASGTVSPPSAKVPNVESN